MEQSCYQQVQLIRCRLGAVAVAGLGAMRTPAVVVAALTRAGQVAPQVVTAALAAVAAAEDGAEYL